MIALRQSEVNPKWFRAYCFGLMGQEARSLVKARKLGVHCPTLLHVDTEMSCLYLEKVPGQMVKELLYSGELSKEGVLARTCFHIVHGKSPDEKDRVSVMQTSMVMVDDCNFTMKLLLSCVCDKGMVCTGDAPLPGEVACSIHVWEGSTRTLFCARPTSARTLS